MSEFIDIGEVEIVRRNPGWIERYSLAAAIQGDAIHLTAHEAHDEEEAFRATTHTVGMPEMTPDELDEMISLLCKARDAVRQQQAARGQMRLRLVSDGSAA
ncbi:MAG: hypothetical protein QJR02_15920 [Sinobacteraceae bacterium]|nr:hypothetical protein [Nevskiaceae bacterium]